VSRRGAALAALVVSMAACSGPEPARRPPPSPATRGPGNGWNVLLVTVDTLRADHLGAYGYAKSTSPRIDVLARKGTVFERAYTFWPKTRASFIMMLTGRRPSQNGYSRRNPVLLDFNPTLASILKEAGYRTAAIVDNANVARALGYAKGFETYREIWEEPALEDEWEGTKAITEGGMRFLRDAPKDRPFFLWLHYVNPHAPYTPPVPFDAQFVTTPELGRDLAVVPSHRGGIPRALFVAGQRRLGYYVAQYDGEVVAVDQQIGAVLDALEASGAARSTLVVFTSDHGESLGEHDYYFDHGQDLFDPCLEVPLVVVAPDGVPAKRSDVLASTLDIVPTVLDAVKVPYPPDLAGKSLFPVVRSGAGPRRDRLFAQNDHNMTAAFDGRYKLIATFGKTGTKYALYDRQTDPHEARDVSRERSEELRVQRRELELFVEETDREWSITRRLLEGRPASEEKMSPEACERLKALGYAIAGCKS
jgi:arylsulfatase A-like enzyme